MIGYIVLGAWLLTLIILGFIVISTGLPNQITSEEGTFFTAWFAKLAYLVALAVTFYEMGVHFSNL